MNRFVPFAAALIGLSLACSKPQDGAQPAASATAQASAAPSAQGSAAASAAPSGSGSAATGAGATAKGQASSYDGKYTTTALSTINVPEGAKWKGEDSQDGVGEGKLALAVDGDGRVTGTYEGALGAGTADGQVQGDTLTATLRPKDPAAPGFYGTVLAKIAGDKVDGTLAASRGNAGLVREGKLSLAKK
jgi:hypothetical protein